MSFHVALLWALFWISGLGPLLVMLYIPIGLAWIIVYGLYLGVRKVMPRISQHHNTTGE